MVMRAIQICTNEIVQGMNMVTVMLVCIISVKWHDQIVRTSITLNVGCMQSVCPQRTQTPYFFDHSSYIIGLGYQWHKWTVP